jgi:transcriptional antiterminator NusG
MENQEAKNQQAKWYVLHTFSGYENVAKENLETVIEKYNLQDRIFDIVIPMEDVIEERNGKKKLVQRKVMPCYLLVKMIYGDDLWHNVTRTRGITGFVGPKGRPLALTDEEVMKMRLEKINIPTSLEVGDKIEVIEGALNTMIGTIISVDNTAQRAKVNLEMFGRETPVDLAFSQIRKIN